MSLDLRSLCYLLSEHYALIWSNVAFNRVAIKVILGIMESKGNEQ